VYDVSRLIQNSISRGTSIAATERRENTTLNNADKPIRNPYVVLREEFDDWAVLFNPDAAPGFNGFGLNPTSVYIWKLLDGENTLEALLNNLRTHVNDVTEAAGNHINVFVDALVAGGLAAYGDTASYREKSSRTSLAGPGEVAPFTYDAPQLVNLGTGQAAIGKTCTPHGSSAAYCCGGAAAPTSCAGGTCTGTSSSCISNGSTDGTCCSSGGCDGAPCTSYGCTDTPSCAGRPCGDCYDGSNVMYFCSNGTAPPPALSSHQTTLIERHLQPTHPYSLGERVCS
jgi:SynChlorMet cassette protein ScmD